MRPMRVRVPVATVWVAPDRPRPVDAAVVADEPDLGRWLAAMDGRSRDDRSPDGRRGLHGRVHTQLLAGEPVYVLPGADPAYPGWVEVVCPWQPSSLDTRGYPGWVRRAHLADDNHWPDRPDWPEPTAVGGPTSASAPTPAAVALALRHLGLPYLWGGMSPFGLDCSGLVHLVHRQLGVVLPRDAHDQQAACRPVDPEAVRPGDLVFFAEAGEVASHVGIVSGPGRMIHAAGSREVVEEQLDDRHRATLSGAGRVGD